MKPYSKQEQRMLLIKSICIIVLIWILTYIAASKSCAQDTICVTRSEMIHYASNSIKLKTCESNYTLIQSSNELCKTNLYKSVELNDKLIHEIKLKDELYSLTNKDLKKQIRRKTTWKIASFSLLTALLITNIF
jgi:hypothetical protein